jgi:anti-sigma B factor antagonist
MEITHKVNNELCTIVISGELSIYTAKLTQETLMALLQSEKKIALDLSDVYEIDSAGIQLLLSLKKQAHEQDISLTFHSHSECVLNAINLYNISAELGDPLLPIQH